VGLFAFKGTSSYERVSHEGGRGIPMGARTGTCFSTLVPGDQAKGTLSSTGQGPGAKERKKSRIVWTIGEGQTGSIECSRQRCGAQNSAGQTRRGPNKLLCHLTFSLLCTQAPAKAGLPRAVRTAIWVRTVETYRCQLVALFLVTTKKALAIWPGLFYLLLPGDPLRWKPWQANILPCRDSYQSQLVKAASVLLAA
jgi:hypothetical protein